MVVVDGGRHLDVHADILVSELGVDQGADHGRRCAGLIRTGGDGDALADFERRLLCVGGADARILQNLGIRIGKQQVGRGRSDRYRKVSGFEVRQVVERWRRAVVGGSSGSGGCARRG